MVDQLSPMGSSRSTRGLLLVGHAHGEVVALVGEVSGDGLSDCLVRDVVVGADTKVGSRGLRRCQRRSTVFDQGSSQ